MTAPRYPLLALSAGKRIVLHNGGIRAVLETNEEESEALRKLREADLLNTSLRRAIRAGERIVSHVGTV